MTHFVKNEGQFHPRVAYVAKIEDDLKDRYHGCTSDEIGSKAAIGIDKNGNVLNFGYHTDDTAEPNYPWIGEEPDFDGCHCVLYGWASCYELGIDHGTGEAAVLNLIWAGDIK